MNTNQLTKLAVGALEDVKGVDIQVIDVSGLTSVTDHLVIATGTSSRHVKALADSVIEKALEAGVRPLSSQGLEQGEWALVDLNGVVVHTLQASARAHYQLEKLWDLGQPKPVLDEPKPAKAKVKSKAKAPVKKAAVKKAVPARKAVAPQKSAPAKKAAPVTKTAASKSAAKSAAKSAPKPLSKLVAKKAAVKKPAAKKAVAKKPAAKKAR
ncbi:ribosome silencing factor [Stagnimonas aquatica]|uniref:Ribosomal silencing factor RsfS n=1 Tax=Stagnimonas aquatica TaxID=2689987 RepID=A0A3N0VKM1_9GAMM|nr:ribosome silencing factor [Stagnimonas aquatica]